LTAALQGVHPVSLDFVADPAELTVAVVQGEVLVEAAQHHREVLLLLASPPMPVSKQPLAGTSEELSATLGAGDPDQGEPPDRSSPQTCLKPRNSNRRLIAADDDAIAFRWKDYRVNGPDRWKTMRLQPHEFIRRFLIHVLPKGFHRIRHYGLFASTNRAESIATARALLNVAPPTADPQQEPDVAPDTLRVLPWPCPRCGARVIVIETFAPGCEPNWRPTPNRIDTS
jgi:hypothetical protein